MHLRTLAIVRPKRLLIGAVLAALALGTMLGLRQNTAHGIPVPPLTYSVVAVSGSHTASLLNLPVGQPGTYQAPVPVDVNGDLLPDVLVSVNLVNVNGVFNNPPNVGTIIAPNIQIDRMVTSPVLGQPSPPLKIEVKLSVADSAGGAPTVLTFGYDTGAGGTIPTYYHALINGLTSFFNPLQAVVDTTGTVVGLQPNINELGLAPVAAPYQGPLHVIGGISTGGFNANLDFAFRPFPRTVTVGYSTDSEGQHITYADNYTGPVGLSAGISLTSGTSTTNLITRIDRLPQNMAIDVANGGPPNSGSIDFRSNPTGRLPDVGATLSTTSPGARPLNAVLSIDALPAVMHAEWSLPSGGPAHAAFCAPAAASSSPCSAPQGAGIGSIQAQVTNYAAGGSSIVPYVPDQQQFLNFQQGGSNPSDPDMLITARVERIRQLNFTQSAAGVDATAQLGDGELPLLAHFVTDGRGGTAPGPYTEATATISPLPSSAHLNFVLPSTGGSSPAPTVLTYNASSPVDITGNFTSFATGSGGTCGSAGTICAALQAFHIPSQIVTTITDQPSSAQINVDSSNPGATASDEPDFIADATLGQTDAAHPIVAHASLLGFPNAVTIYTHEGVNDTLDDAEFHACDWNVTTAACAPGQAQGKVGGLSFNVHDWVNRPAGLAVAIPTTPNYADVVAQGVPTPGDSTVNFEATGEIKDIAELDYRNTGGVSGVRVNAGNGLGFSAHLDAQNILTSPTSDRISATVDALVKNLPSQFDVCFRQPNRDLAATGASFTVPCEDANPFSGANPLTQSPLTFSYRASAPFSVLTSGKVVDEGPDSITKGFDNRVGDDRTYQGTLDVANLPKNLTANLQMPPSGTSGAIRALYCSGSVLPATGSCPSTAPSDSQINIGFAASVTDADLQCKDPRTPGANQIALCAQGTLENLPSHALVTYDPTVSSNNFSVTTTGDQPMSLVGDAPCLWGSATPVGTTIAAGSPQCFEFSSVSLDSTNGKPKVLIADGNIASIPKSVTGTLFFPSGGSPDVDLTATPALGHVDAVVRNFIAPNPILQSVPARDAGFGSSPTQQVSFFQRGSAFEAEAHIGDVKGFGYQTAADASGVPLDTQLIRAQFGGNEVVRAYADIEPSDQDRMIGDVTLNNVPAGLNMCVRGKDTHTSTVAKPGYVLFNGTWYDQPAASQASFCDAGDSNISVNPLDGSFQYAGSPAAGASAGLGVDAFVRQATGGNSNILSGRVHIDGIPDVVEGTFPSSSTDGDLDVGGFDPCGESGTPSCGSGQSTGTMVPAGIQQITANLASFDISPSEAGFVPGAEPYAPLQDDNAPFPVTAPTDGHQYLEAALHNSAFQVQAGLGPDSQLQQIEMLQGACAAPSNNPPDYPAFPATVNGKAVKYKCISGNFIQTAPTAPLDLGFIDQTPDGNQLSFGGGLTDLPSHMQMTLSDTGTQTDSSLQPCGPANGSLTTNCVPPLVRFDQPANSVLFGTLKYGSVHNLGLLAGVVNAETAVNVDTPPNPYAASDPWSDWAANGQGGSTDGLRAKLGINNGNLAAIVGVQVHVPQSLTIDQPLGWSQSESSDQADYWQASDTKLHFVVRNSSGAPVGSIGQGAVLFNDFDDGYQVLAGNPCTSVALGDRSSDPGDCNDFGYGFHLPGEFGIAMFRRDNTGQGKDYMQIDGRVSDGTLPLNVGVRLLAVGEQAAIGRLEAQIDHVPTTNGDSGLGPNDPTFRLQEEMVGNGSSPPTGGGNPQPQGEQTQSSCSAFLCTQVDVKIASVFAKFDFQPTPAPPARLVQAVIDQQGSTKQGMEIAGFQGVTDTSPAAPITAQGFVDINPLNIYFDAGIPLIAGLDLVLQSELQASFDANDTTDFYLRENLLHLESASLDQDPSNPSAVGPLNVYIYLLHAEADLLFVPLLTIDFLPPSLPPSVSNVFGPGPPSGPAQLSEVDCENAGTGIVAALFGPNKLPNNTIYPSNDLNNPNSLVIWPFNETAEPRFILGGLLGPAFDVLNQFAAPFFCLSGAGDSDIPLIGTSSATGSPDNYPSDPVGGLSTNPPATSPLVDASHPVPDATVDPTITPATPAPSPIPNKPNPPAPDVTISAPTALCGPHYFGKLDVESTLSVATAAPSPDPNFENSGTTCPAADVGTLTIVTSGNTLTVHSGGAIVGDAAVKTLEPEDLPNGDPGPTSVASDNSGGTHGTAGGQGTSGSGGNAFGNTATDDPTTETGTAGSSVSGGAASGAGGGAITIVADTVVVQSGGAITSNGAAGGNGTAACAGADTAGGGGGSGGGISISATKVVNNGDITADGGSGGSSGIAPGGGGGAGIIKVIAPLQSGNLILSDGGGAGAIPSPGTGSCPNSAGNGGAANFGSMADAAQDSTALPVLGGDGNPKFWNQENTNPATPSAPDLPVTLTVPYQAAASAGASNDMETYLCASYLSTADYQTAAAAHPNESISQLLTMPSGQPGDYVLLPSPLVERSEPCGQNATVYAEQSFSGTDRVDDQKFTVGTFADSTSGMLSTFTGPELADGYYGFYTVVATPNSPADNCADPFNACTWQQLPSTVQQVIGIDNGPPFLSFDVNGSTGGFETSSTKVTLHITATFNVQESGQAQILCSNDGTNFTPCSNGTYDWNLTGGDGPKTVYVEAVNGAGAVTEQQVTGDLDTKPPTISAVVSGGSKVNGWYHALPSIVLSASDTNTGLNPSEAFAYRFDDGAEHPTGSDQVCAGPSPNPITSVPLVPNLAGASCVIPQSLINGLSDGTHTLYFTAIDAVGNRLGPDDDQGNAEPGTQPMESLTIQIDRQAPQSAMLSVPAAPDGTNGWFATRPWVTISAVDQVGGSGLVPSAGDHPVAGVSYYLDGTLHAAPAAPLPPFQLTDGTHTVCWFAQDRAGNFDVSGPGGSTPTPSVLAGAGQCQVFNVDSTAPSTTISLSPGSPNGLHGWYTTPVPLTVNSIDPTPGSGVALVDPNDLCSVSPPAGASGTCVSIDHAAFVPYTAMFIIPEGTHDVRAFSIDAAGNQSAMVDQKINVDLSPPVASALFVPSAPMQDGWWASVPFPGDMLHSPPQVVLRAVDGDQSSGVATLQYQINPTGSSPWVTYTGPFNVPQGVNTVTYRAVDSAGLVEPTQNLSVPVDVTPPVVTATTAQPAVWLQILSILGNILGLSPAQSQLGWTVSDNLSPHVHITVLVFNAAGAVVRQLDGGTYNVTPGTTLSGSTAWDGRDSSITGFVPIGLYYYRVVATDDAGNIAQSGESAPLQIKIL